VIVFGDVAGYFDPLMKLVEQVPTGLPLIFVGDLCDRGPKTKEVVSWIKDNSHASLLGNHEHMMLDFFYNKKQYGEGIWFSNGGYATARSYFPGISVDDAMELPNKPDIWTDTLKEHLDWMQQRPLTYETEDLLISHAPHSDHEDPFEFLWNRKPPSPKDKFQIYGHNGLIKKHGDFAICIDNSRNGCLTAIDTDTKIIYKEAYR